MTLAQTEKKTEAKSVPQAIQDSGTNKLANLNLPKLTIKDPTYDFGKVVEGASVEHDFVLKNEGTADLEIIKAFPDCACGVSLPQNLKLAPGSEGTVKVTLDTTGISGLKIKSVYIYSNDPQRNVTNLSLKGEVEPVAEVVPFRLDFGKVQASSIQAKELSFKVKAIEEVNLKITKVQSASELLTVQEVGTKSKNLSSSQEGTPFRGNLSYTAKLQLDPKQNLPLGLFRSRINLYTNNPKRPIIAVPILADIVGDFELSPEEIAFGLIDIEKEEVLERAVNLKILSKESIQVLATNSNSPFVKSTFQKISQRGKQKVQEKNIEKNGSSQTEDSHYLIKVSLTKPSSSQTLKANISIVTNHPDEKQQVINLPVYAIFGKKGE